MFLQIAIDTLRSGNRTLLANLILVLTSVLLIGFCVNFVDAASVKPGYKYQEIKTIAKELKQRSEAENLEEFVEKSREFIAAHPKYKRVDEVHYLLGNILVQLERVEEGIKVFEDLIAGYPSARYVERCLLALGLAYDKLGKHDLADAAYEKLVNHPKYGSRTQAKFAKLLLKQDKTTRNGELSKPPWARINARDWIGHPTLDFQVTDLKGQEFSLKAYRGQVVLLDFWATWCPPCIAEIPNVREPTKSTKTRSFRLSALVSIGQ